MAPGEVATGGAAESGLVVPPDVLAGVRVARAVLAALPPADGCATQWYEVADMLEDDLEHIKTELLALRNAICSALSHLIDGHLQLAAAALDASGAASCGGRLCALRNFV